jgi:hypothetical protein
MKGFCVRNKLLSIQEVSYQINMVEMGRKWYFDETERKQGENHV